MGLLEERDKRDGWMGWGEVETEKSCLLQITNSQTHIKKRKDLNEMMEKLSLNFPTKASQNVFILRKKAFDV